VTPIEPPDAPSRSGLRRHLFGGLMATTLAAAAVLAAHRLERDDSVPRARAALARAALRSTRSSTAMKPPPPPAPPAPSEPAPQSLISPFLIHGYAERSEVRRVIREAAPRFRSCYEAALRTDPEIAGFLNVDLRIAKDGSVSSVGWDGDLAYKPVARCLRDHMKTLVLPKPDRGFAAVTVIMDFAPG
jgi:hypothetical protein